MMTFCLLACFGNSSKTLPIIWDLLISVNRWMRHENYFQQRLYYTFIIIYLNLTNKRLDKYWYNDWIMILWKLAFSNSEWKMTLQKFTSCCLRFVVNNILLFQVLLYPSFHVLVIYCFVRLVMQRNRLRLLMKCFVNVADLAFADVVVVVPCCFSLDSALNEFVFL